MKAPDALREGSDDALQIDWSAVLGRHDRWLRTVVLARTGEPQAIDDVMQEAALAVLRVNSGPSDQTKLAPWLYRLAVRQALLYRRRMGRARRLHGRYANLTRRAGLNGHAPDPLVWLMGLEQSEMIRTALKGLPRRDAESLLLKYLEGWSHMEIADHLGISHAAVVSRVNRARARLRIDLLEMNVDKELRP